MTHIYTRQKHLRLTKLMQQKMKFVFRIEEIYGQWRKCWLPAFSCVPHCFLTASYIGLLKVKIVHGRDLISISGLCLKVIFYGIELIHSCSSSFSRLYPTVKENSIEMSIGLRKSVTSSNSLN